MKSLFPLLAIALFIFPADYSQDRTPLVAYITKAVNLVEHRTSSTADWTKASTPCELLAGSEVRTGENSLTLITFNDGSKVTMRPRSTIRIIGDISDGKLAIRGLFLTHGRAFFSVKNRGRIILADRDQMTGEFNLNSPVSISSLQAAEGSFSYEPSTRTAEISLSTGSADVSSIRTARRIHLKAGQTATIDSTQCRVR